MVVTMLKCGSKHLSLSLSLLKTINAMEDWEGKGSVFLPLTPLPLELWVFFLFIICLNPEFLHITTRKRAFYQSLAPAPPFQVCPDLPLQMGIGKPSGIHDKLPEEEGGGWWESYLLLNSIPHLKSSIAPHHFMPHRARQDTRYDIAINQSKCSLELGLIDAVHKTGK